MFAWHTLWRCARETAFAFFTEIIDSKHNCGSARRGRSAGVATVVVALALMLATPFVGQAQAGYWTATGVSGTFGPGNLVGGANAAVQSFSAAPVNFGDAIEECYPGHNSAGQLTIYVCDPYPQTVTTQGVATLHCDLNTEIRTAWGCEDGPPPETACHKEAGNPVNVITGVKYERVTDFATAGPSALAFRRSYASRFSVSAGRAVFKTRVGLGWRSNFDSAAFFTASNPLNPANNNLAYVSLPNGREVVLRYDAIATEWVPVYPNGIILGGISWSGPRTDIDAKLEAVGGTLELTIDGNVTYVYDIAGRLQNLRQRDGYTLAFTYDANGRNTKVTDNRNREISFAYSIHGLIDSMTTPDGAVYKYEYKGLVDYSSHPPVTDPETVASDIWVLEKVIYPDDTPGTDADNPTVTYHYENVDFATSLTGITDEKGVRYATWTYGTDGRVLTSEHANIQDKYTFAYDDVAQTRTVTNPLTKDTVYHLETFQGRNRITRLEGKASANCVADDTVFAYDANGFVDEMTDGEGNVTKYVNDAQGRRTTVTQGHGQPEVQHDHGHVGRHVGPAGSNRRTRCHHRLHLRCRRPAHRAHTDRYDRPCRALQHERSDPDMDLHIRRVQQFAAAGADHHAAGGRCAGDHQSGCGSRQHRRVDHRHGRPADQHDWRLCRVGLLYFRHVWIGDRAPGHHGSGRRACQYRCREQGGQSRLAPRIATITPHSPRSR